ncbi:MAG TPA: PSD1 and planctomycete cytochrome C domain-containing protein, partial [Pirellulales bacterium]|nr:PSD1 and planctomycete cytochrome C domain-containing protein [Pirellulales bacterium]
MAHGYALRNISSLASIVVLGIGARLCGGELSTVDYSRDVRPILSQHCYACHGPDEASREAGLRLDRADAATAELESGATAVVPGSPEASEVIARITSDDSDLRMPPTSTGHRLGPDEIDLLTRWIGAGAKFDDHWSFRPVVQTRPPVVQNPAWVRNPIDAFILARLERAKIAFSPEADRTTLMRRLSLDLIGLPPQPQEIAEFVRDESPDAYEQLVDRLLASPHFGERWGRHWLDLAHYADSDGYLGDGFRGYAWLYRDWVIDAMNADMPFDQFTIEQLAGDLLPEATLAQRTATGFLRNTMRNTEAGVDLEEYRLKEVVDRVSTIGVGWLGLSLGCAECHSHKFDPVSHREFYEMFAFFNDADDVDVPAPQPGEMERYDAKFAAWTQDDEEFAAKFDKQFGSQSQPLRVALAIDAKKRTAEQKKTIEALIESAGDDAQLLCSDYAKHSAAKPAAPKTKAMTVAKRKTPRTSYVHLRGDYRSRGEDVAPGTPAILPPLEARGPHADRLDFARWLVDPENPLTPRVTVNRIWQHLFGRGLVATVDNFGSGGEAPSHAELLDWLAREFMDGGWSHKAMIRRIVTSATYRQASSTRPELERRDPLNVWLARQSRLRLEAEAVRDAALCASNLLERRIGGPGIRPPQPEYVASISRNTDWKVSTGPDLYRRGMYIVFRRATPYPMLLAFDAPDSTVACTRRERSNSPLQALTLLNDPVFFECAQALGR